MVEGLEDLVTQLRPTVTLIEIGRGEGKKGTYHLRKKISAGREDSPKSLRPSGSRAATGFALPILREEEKVPKIKRPPLAVGPQGEGVPMSRSGLEGKKKGNPSQSQIHDAQALPRGPSNIEMQRGSGWHYHRSARRKVLLR